MFSIFLIKYMFLVKFKRKMLVYEMMSHMLGNFSVGH